MKGMRDRFSHDACNGVSESALIGAQSCQRKSLIPALLMPSTKFLIFTRMIGFILKTYEFHPLGSKNHIDMLFHTF